MLFLKQERVAKKSYFAIEGINQQCKFKIVVTHREFLTNKQDPSIALLSQNELESDTSLLMNHARI